MNIKFFLIFFVAMIINLEAKAELKLVKAEKLFLGNLRKNRNNLSKTKILKKRLSHELQYSKPKFFIFLIANELFELTSSPSYLKQACDHFIKHAEKILEDERHKFLARVHDEFFIKIYNKKLKVRLLTSMIFELKKLGMIEHYFFIVTMNKLINELIAHGGFKTAEAILSKALRVRGNGFRDHYNLIFLSSVCKIRQGKLVEARKFLDGVLSQVPKPKKRQDHKMIVPLQLLALGLSKESNVFKSKSFLSLQKLVVYLNLEEYKQWLVREVAQKLKTAGQIDKAIKYVSNHYKPTGRNFIFQTEVLLLELYRKKSDFVNAKIHESRIIEGKLFKNEFEKLKFFIELFLVRISSKNRKTAERTLQDLDMLNLSEYSKAIYVAPLKKLFKYVTSKTPKSKKELSSSVAMLDKGFYIRSEVLDFIK